MRNRRTHSLQAVWSHAEHVMGSRVLRLYGSVQIEHICLYTHGLKLYINFIRLYHGPGSESLYDG
jgi:hypothetical protein